ncbi:MAG TPA: SpoIIE family protein phosphatase [Cytophagaceae bacterium]|nr:SpoIIE family protein phosphatase [Cytophagaceae bacterium]
MKKLFWLLSIIIYFFSITYTGAKGSKDQTGEEYYALGIAAMDKSDFAGALKNFEKSRLMFEKTGNSIGSINSLHKLGEVYNLSSKYPKAIKEFDDALKKSILVKNEKLTELSYKYLYETYQLSRNEKKATEFFGYYNSFKTKRENKELAKANQVSELQINKLKEQKLMSELGKKEAENLLEVQTSKLLQTEDSLAILDILNKQTKAQIQLLQKEKELKDLKVKEQESRLKINLLALREKEAQLKTERAVLFGLIIIVLMVLVLAYVMYRNYKQKQAANAMIEEQLGVIQSQHTNITNSINYAQRIQNAMLPGERSLKSLVDDSFVLFKPKDVVSGDFYWFYNIKTGTNLNEYDPEADTGVEKLPDANEARKVVVAAVDCTGHGVPGALMSMIGYNLLNTIAARNITESDKILSELNKNVRFALQQYKNDNKDGMDMSLVVIDKDRKTLEFAGAKNPLVYIQDGELFHIKGDSHPIGGSQGEAKRNYTKHTISIDKPTFFYMFSDGYADQFGGEEGKKFMIKNFKDLLLKIHTLPFEEQKIILNKTIESWKGNLEKQLDDILVMGMRVG